MVKGTHPAARIFFFFFVCEAMFPKLWQVVWHVNINRFFSEQFFLKMHRKLLIHRKRWFVGIFKPYLLPQIWKLKAAFFAFFSSFVPLPNSDFFLDKSFSFRDILMFHFFFKKSIRLREILFILFCLWSDVPKILTSDVTREYKHICLLVVFFEKCIENFLFIENGDFWVFFKPYLLPLI